MLNNSHVVDWYFDYLLKKFLKVFFHDVLECEWRWHRYEWQMRNAIHAHGAARLKNDPGLIELTKVAYEGRLAEEKICKLRESNRPVDQLLEVAVENGKLAEERVCSNADTLLSAFNSRLSSLNDAQVPEPHPCSRDFKYISPEDYDNDYEELVNCC